MKRVTVVDYGMGNLGSVAKALERSGARVTVSPAPEEAARAEALVLPGVGAFGDAARALRERGVDEAVKDFIASGRPFLGICLGLQLLFPESEEAPGGPPGLGLLEGRVRRFPEAGPDGRRLKVPHIGWNQVWKGRETPLSRRVAEGQYFYFVHSYYAAPEEEEVTALWCEYGGVRFCAMAARGNVYATQFHPEKSQREGLALLSAFLEL